MQSTPVNMQTRHLPKHDCAIVDKTECLEKIPLMLPFHLAVKFFFDGLRILKLQIRNLQICDPQICNLQILNLQKRRLQLLIN